MKRDQKADNRQAERRSLYEQFLQCLDREEMLTHHRMTWFFQWNTVFVGAVILLHTHQVIDVVSGVARGMTLFLSVMGIIVCILAFYGIRAAKDQIEYLIKKLEERLGVKDHHWETTEFLRPYGNPHSSHPTAKAIARFFPIILGMTWVAVVLLTMSSIKISFGE